MAQPQNLQSVHTIDSTEKEKEKEKERKRKGKGKEKERKRKGKAKGKGKEGKICLAKTRRVDGATILR